MYENFIKSKIVKAEKTGFEIDKKEIHPAVFPHQRDIIAWNISGGCRANFASFGLGKTIIQLETCRLIVKHKGGRALIICPLGVKQEFQRDAREILNMPAPVYVRTTEEVLSSDAQFFITNYERVRDGGIDVNLFTVVSLDEASVLRGFGTKTYQTFLQLFKDVPFRYVCTATPSPNRHKELIHYAGFLGVMDTGQALTRFFQRNSEKAGDLQLHPHKEEEFWRWMATWAVFIQKPSDLGYSDEGYDLPDLKVFWHEIPVDHSEAGFDKQGNAKMFRDATISLPDAAREKRDTAPARLAKAIEIMQAAGHEDHWLLWHHLEYERELIEKEILQARTLYGRQKDEEKEDLLIGFSNGDFQILATKPEIAGSGCNFQRYCHKNIFIGVNYQFNDFIQAIHRTHRFQQKHAVEVHIIYAESERQIVKVLQEKWKQHEELVSKMTDLITQYGLSKNVMQALERKIDVERIEKKGDLYTWVNNDCIDECARMQENSVDLIVTSIPFGNQYEYSASYRDFGHNPSNDRFFDQMDYLTPNLYRILKPGRIAAIHVKDRIRFGNVTGFGRPMVDRFSDKTADHFEKHGFLFCGRITVVTDVVHENNQTYRLGWSENAKDSSKMGVGMSEYVLLFFKPQTDLSKGYSDVPVTKDKEEYTRAQWQIDAHGYWRSRGNRFFTPEELAQKELEQVKRLWESYNLSHIYDYEEHVEIGRELERLGRLPASFMLFSPQSWNDDVWTDVTRMLTLNSEQSKKNLSNHICPLQFDIVDRLIDRYSNPGETVCDPFGGIGTVPYRAILKGRKGYGVELNPAYWTDGLSKLKAAEYKMTIPTLFDLEEIELKTA